MNFLPTHAARMQRVMKWYARARIGAFYHYGLYTGGGNACSDTRWAEPMKYTSIEAFEKDADPDVLAKNLAALALRIGAKYTTLTVYHTCGHMCVLYPTHVAGFNNKTNKDYIGPYLREARAAGLHPMLYLPCDCNNSEVPPLAPAVDAALSADIKGRYEQAMCEIVDEIRERYGDLVDGFWLDGSVATDNLPAHIRKVYPDAIVIGNNRDELDLPDVDYGTTEMHDDAEQPNPAWDRPSGYRHRNAWGCATPGRDFNEDIPTTNDWWYHGNDAHIIATSPYVADPLFLVKQCCTSLGSRGMWNFQLGIGPRIDGTAIPCLEPAYDALGRFLQIYGEAIYNTKGTEGTILQPSGVQYRGNMQYAATVSLDDPNTFYVIVTQRPESSDILPIETSGVAPKRITDLRSGKEMNWKGWQRVFIQNVDWTDVDELGAKVFKIEF